MEQETDEQPKQATISDDNVIVFLTEEVRKLYEFKDLFFENHPLEMASEKPKLIAAKLNELTKKFEDIDEDTIPMDQRAKLLYLQGRAYNVSTTYDARATQLLNKAVKMNPRMVEAWIELGESYWKNKNLKEAKNSFEAAIQQERNRVALRCLSMILRQEIGKLIPEELVIQRSVELAKEAVAIDPKDGMSWCVLGNAQLCKYFKIAQEPATLKASMSAYRQAETDAVARGEPDLYVNCATAFKYDEQYDAALEKFSRACALDPLWDVPAAERARLTAYVRGVSDLVHAKGKIKGKRLRQMVQSIDPKMAGHYLESPVLLPTPLSELVEGENKGRLALGKVVGSVHSENLVPFTFAIIDASLQCTAVTVYNWANGRGVIINDAVAVPHPLLSTKTGRVGDKEYNFRSIRVNNPMQLLINGRRVGRDQVAGTCVSSTIEIH